MDGVLEDDGENLRDLVNNMFTDLNLNFDSSVCVNVFRRGKKQVGDRAAAVQPGSIVIIFQRQHKKGEIFRARRTFLMTI